MPFIRNVANDRSIHMQPLRFSMLAKMSLGIMDMKLMSSFDRGGDDT